MSEKEIHCTTLEEQGKRLREYSKKLSCEKRLELLQELNRRAFGNQNSEECLLKNREPRIFSQVENESEEEFFKRVNRENKNANH
jgi:Mg/Co/Ni transporter MgtE